MSHVQPANKKISIRRQFTYVTCVTFVSLILSYKMAIRNVSNVLCIIVYDIFYCDFMTLVQNMKER